MAKSLPANDGQVDIEDLEQDQCLDLNTLQREVFLKILVLGDLGVGKTSLVRRYTNENNEQSTPDYKVSVDIGYSLKSVEVNGRKVNIQLWDIPGHERFGGMTRVYYKYAHGALLVFDLSRPETFESALSWLTDVTEKLFDDRRQLIAEQAAAAQGRATSPAVAMDDINKALPVVLLANKCDLPSLKVPRHKYSSYVQENGLLAWFETSARDETYLAHAVKKLVEYILETDPTLLLHATP